MNIKCPNCLQEIPNQSRFCVHCGSELNNPLKASATQEEIHSNTSSKKKLWEILNIGILLIAIICIASFTFYFIENKIQETADKGIENDEIIENLYRNSKYKFRIKFPEKWKIEKGDGPNILIKATNNNGSNINILVKDTGAAIGDIDDILTLDEWAESVFEKFPDANILLKKEISIDNRKAFIVKYSLTYKTLDKEANSTLYSVALTHNNFFYVITASAKTRLFEDERLTLETAISTFVIEN